ncbi:MAG TPA: DUF2891 domain-containing protein [Steroidobacteraceae bacterium]|nr:DUF2891 domain-containing protein [Steroidobacteraceae bacterium]
MPRKKSLLLSAALLASTAATAAPLDPAAAQRFATLALTCLHQEFPNKIAHVLENDADVLPPRVLYPAFHGCYDWHSSVHGHWLLVRLIREVPDAPYVPDARAALARSLTTDHLAAETAYLKRAGRASFERPYGLAWLLQLAAELRSWDDRQAREWSRALEPLEAEAAAHLGRWLPELHYPIRVGEHDQTAFSFGLIWDWATVANQPQMLTLLRDAARRFYLHDVSCPISYEPSGHDFLSPCLAEADFMRRVLTRAEFSAWLSRALPGIPRRAKKPWLAPAVVTNRADPKLAHLDGLNLSRAWMLRGIAGALDPDDRRVAALREAARLHADAALPQVTGEHYEGGHWLGTFAVYLETGAGESSGSETR